MKVKDLFDFNPEAEICFLGLDYLPIELDIYGWSSDDDTNSDSKSTTSELLLMFKKDNYTQNETQNN